MSDESTSTAYHESAHAVAAQTLGLPVTYLSIRPAEGESGRVKFHSDSEALGNRGAFECAIIKVAGRVDRLPAPAPALVGAAFHVADAWLSATAQRDQGTKGRRVGN